MAAAANALIRLVWVGLGRCTFLLRTFSHQPGQREINIAAIVLGLVPVGCGRPTVARRICFGVSIVYRRFSDSLPVFTGICRHV
ncbi:MAG: hypothetical protein R2867_11315 [Caldilineaceae bacterium]